ncbi:MAG: Gfo/Idh/MocA family protein [Planctomycetota bacterium]|jgi:predicted dehydrogenase
MAVKIGIAGLGTYFGGMWAAVFNQYAKSDLVAVCDLRPGRAEEVAGWFEGTAPLTSYDDLLASDADAIGVFTPGPLHAEHVIAALQAGKHVLSAVPTAWSLDECQDIIDAVERTGRKYMLAETPSYDPWVSKVRQMHAAGEMGEVFYVERTTFQDLSGPLMGNDYFSQADTPDVIYGQTKYTWRYGIPPFYYMEHSAGPILMALDDRMTEVTATGMKQDESEFIAKYGAPYSEPHGNPFICESGLFRLASGGVANITIGFAAAFGKEFEPPTRLVGTKASYVIEAENDKLLTKSDTQVIEKPAQHRPLDPSVADCAEMENSAYVVQDFVQCVLDDTPPPIDIYRAVSFTAAGLCGHQSAMEGRTVTIPDFSK